MNALRIMLIDANRGRAAILEQALADAGCQVVARLSEPGDLLKQVQELAPDVILIDVDSPDRDILENLYWLDRNQPHPIVMFAEDAASDTIGAAVRAGVSAYVVDGLQPQRVRPIIEVAIARFREFQALRRELEETRNKLAERKVIEKAKGLLMQQKNSSEEEAYQALRKLAMDRNQRLAEVARNVIAVLELLG
jgi:response regulator NasT